MTHTVVGLFDSRSDAQAAMQELTSNGFIKEDIDLSNRSLAETSAGTEGTNAGAGYDSGEGIGDRIANFFNSLFGDDEDTAASYTNAASGADAILTVHVDSDERARKAQQILDRHDAMDVNAHDAQYGQRSGTADTSMKIGDNKQTIPVVEEKLNVGKREVERGGASIRSRVVEKPVEATVRLREEHVVVNRRPVDRAITDADRKNFQPGEMNITERAEVPVIGKEARVVEEVEVGIEN